MNLKLMAMPAVWVVGVMVLVTGCSRASGDDPSSEVSETTQHPPLDECTNDSLAGPGDHVVIEPKQPFDGGPLVLQLADGWCEVPDGRGSPPQEVMPIDGKSFVRSGSEEHLGDDASIVMTVLGTDGAVSDLEFFVGVMSDDTYIDWGEWHATEVLGNDALTRAGTDGVQRVQHLMYFVDLWHVTLRGFDVDVEELVAFAETVSSE